MTDKVDSKRPSSRDRLPGISAKFDAVSAGKLWNFAVGQELKHVEHPRVGAEGTRRVHGFDGNLYTKHNTYVDVDRTPEARMSRFRVSTPPREDERPAATFPVARGDRQLWEEKYRFFSRPYNVEKQRVQGFENYRMRKLFETREQARNDPVIDHSPVQLDNLEMKDVDQDYSETLDGAVRELQQVRKQRASEAQFAGVRWHKYKYFSGGSQYPNTGYVDRFFTNQPDFQVPRPPSFLRGTAPVPQIRPSLIAHKALAASAESAVVRAAAASLALQLCPWPRADKDELSKWRHSSRVPKAVDAAIKSALALAQLGFIPGAEWFLSQADKRASLIDYLDASLLETLRQAHAQVQRRSHLLISSVRPYSATQPDLDKSLREADAAGCVAAVGNLLKFPTSSNHDLLWGLLPQIFFLRQLRELQSLLETPDADVEEILRNFRPQSKREFPSQLVLLLEASDGTLWAVTSAGRAEIARAGHFMEISDRLKTVLLRNKEAVKKAEKEKVEIFWRERRQVESEIVSLLADADTEIQPYLQQLLPRSGEIFLGIPTCLCDFPFEALRTFRGRDVVRAVPVFGASEGGEAAPKEGGFGVVNPGGDLVSTEREICGILETRDDFRLTVGSPLEEQTLLRGLETRRDFVYAGHCGGERFFNGSAIQRTRVAAQVHLFGCRSAEIHRGFATPWHYLVGGAPAVTGVLWDVLGRDCDRVTRKFLHAVLDERSGVAEALAQARQVAKFPNLTGAAFVVFKPIRTTSYSCCILETSATMRVQVAGKPETVVKTTGERRMETVDALAWTADGERLAVCTKDGSVRVQRGVSEEFFMTGSWTHTEPHPTNPELLTCVGWDGKIRVLDLRGGYTEAKGEEKIFAASYACDGNFLAVHTRTDNVHVYDARNLAAPLRSATNLKHEVNATVWSAAGELWAAMSNGYLAMIDSGRVEIAHQGPALALGRNNDGSRLVSSGADGNVAIWNSEIPFCERTISSAQTPVTTLSVSTSAPLVAFACGKEGDAALYVGGIETGALLASVDVQTSVGKVAFHPRSLSVAFATISAQSDATTVQLARFESY